MRSKRHVVRLIKLLMVLYVPIVAYASIDLDPSISSEDVSITQITVDDVVYDLIAVSDYPDNPAITIPGNPHIPSLALNFLLPTDQQIDEIEVLAMDWDTIPGALYLYPVQNLSMEDSTFIPPNPDIYLLESHWPDTPVELISQSGMMGVGVATILTIPLRYIPADSVLLSLSEITLEIDYGTAQFEVIVPVSETAWSNSNRIQGILASVQNSGDYGTCSTNSMRRDLDNQIGPLAITDVPSPNGDGVDFVIITTDALEDDWQELADIRIKQGIISVVRTVEWIESEYDGCDTQEKIKNFITDAYEFWGTGIVLLGGDHELIPSRICKENQSSSSNGYPSDSYYADTDQEEAWISSYGYWYQEELGILLDVSVGRIPVDNSEMVQNFTDKLLIYENPTSLPSGFARAAVFMGGINDIDTTNPNGIAADDMEALNQDLISAGIAGTSGKYLDSITELYFPESGELGGGWSGDLLTRNSALDALSDGAHIIFHADHSGTHQLGTQAAKGMPLTQYIREGDIQDLGNDGMPGILISIGCLPGHFQGADCIVERGLFASNGTGLIAGMAFAKSGYWSDPAFFFNRFANALYEFESYGSSGSSARIGPYVYLGNSYNYMLNKISRSNERHMNLLGDPSMFVWRGNPSRPGVSASPENVTAGTFSTTIHVTEMGSPLGGATVCLFKEGELFVIKRTDSSGDAVFNNIQVATPGVITVTVTKRKDFKQNGKIVNFLPASTNITVEQSTSALLCLNALNVDDDDVSGTSGNDDEEINPGETIKLDLVVNNTGQISATNATAALSIVSGSAQVEDQIDMTQTLGTVATGTSTYTGAFSLEIADDVEPGSDPVILQVAFSYDQGSRNDPADFRVLVGEIDLPVRTMTITEANPLVINIDNMFLTNAGLGNLEDVEVEFTNPSGGLLWSGDQSEVIGDLDNCSGEEFEDGIRATLRNPSGCWNPITSSATFDLKISHRWGEETISVNAYDVVTQGAVQPPSESSFEILSATHDQISFEWEESSSTSTGLYLWKRADQALYWTRVNTVPLDKELEHGSIGDLVSGTDYSVGVSVVGEEGQESSIASLDASTTCDEVAGWPVYLDGSTGTGPVIADIDDDGSNEVIAATSAGSVYIVESNGTATQIYESSYLFSGVAIGDVLVGNRDEIVVCGWDYDMDTGKKAVVVVLSWNQGWQGTEIDADYGSDQRTHENFSVPVLFNADNSGNLEIALRTFNGPYYGSQYSWLYVWEYVNSQWDEMSDFPKVLSSGEYDFCPPVYIGDTDSDNYPELVVTDGIETLYWIEPETGDDDVWNVGSCLPSNYDWNLGQSFMTAVEDGGTVKLIVVGHDGNYYSTACINAENEGSSFWFSDPNTTSDPFGNLGGPAIGDVDGDSYLDIVNQWIQVYPESGLIEYLALSDGARTTSSDVPYNTQREDFAMSPVVLAGNEGDGLALFGSISTVSHGSVIYSGTPELIPGSSYWSQDRTPSSPVVGNIDNDSDLEVIFCDDSGVLHALDMDLATSSGDWPMLQHDLHRTGYFNFSAKGGCDTSRDFQIVDVYSENASVLSEGNRSITVDVVISGTEETDNSVDRVAVIAPAQNSALVATANSSNSARISSSAANSMNVNSIEMVTVALFNGNRMLCTRRLPLADGRSSVVLSASSRDLNGEITVAVDPFGEYQEADESNNTMSMETISRPIEQFTISSSSEGITVSVPAGMLSQERAEAALFSIDGRLVSACSAENSTGEGFSMTLANSTGSLPFGCYVILLTDGDDIVLRRKVLVID